MRRIRREVDPLGLQKNDAVHYRVLIPNVERDPAGAGADHQDCVAMEAEISDLSDGISQSVRAYQILRKLVCHYDRLPVSRHRTGDNRKLVLIVSAKLSGPRRTVDYQNVASCRLFRLRPDGRIIEEHVRRALNRILDLHPLRQMREPLFYVEPDEIIPYLALIPESVRAAPYVNRIRRSHVIEIGERKIKNIVDNRFELVKILPLRGVNELAIRICERDFAKEMQMHKIVTEMVGVVRSGYHLVCIW